MLTVIVKYRTWVSDNIDGKEIDKEVIVSKIVKVSHISEIHNIFTNVIEYEVLEADVLYSKLEKLEKKYKKLKKKNKQNKKNGMDWFSVYTKMLDFVYTVIHDKSIDFEIDESEYPGKDIIRAFKSIINEAKK